MDLAFLLGLNQIFDELNIGVARFDFEESMWLGGSVGEFSVDDHACQVVVAPFLREVWLARKMVAWDNDGFVKAFVFQDQLVFFLLQILNCPCQWFKATNQSQISLLLSTAVCPNLSITAFLTLALYLESYLLIKISKDVFSYTIDLFKSARFFWKESFGLNTVNDITYVKIVCFLV